MRTLRCLLLILFALNLIACNTPPDGFSPREQGIFLAQAAALIRKNDPDAVILAPALPGLSEYEWGAWLPRHS